MRSATARADRVRMMMGCAASLHQSALALFPVALHRRPRDLILAAQLSERFFLSFPLFYESLFLVKVLPQVIS